MVRTKGGSRSRSRSRSVSSSRSRTPSRSRSRSRSASPKRKKPSIKRSAAGKAKKSCGTSRKGYTLVAENINAIPAAQRGGYCTKCKQKVHLVEGSGKLVQMCSNNSFAVMGICGNCKKQKVCRYVKRPSGM